MDNLSRRSVDGPLPCIGKNRLDNAYQVPAYRQRWSFTSIYTSGGEWRVDIAPTPAWYLGTGEHRKIDAEAASVDQFAQSSSKRTDWRCDPTDPDGKRGALNVAEPKVDMLPPMFPSGACIIRAQPFHLVHSPARLLHRTIEITRMGCYRHGLSDYRCIPFQVHRRLGPDNQPIVMAEALSGPTVQSYVDENCPTLRRGREVSGCNLEV